MDWVDELGTEVSRAESLEVVTSLFVDAAFGKIGVSATTMFPLFAGAQPAAEATFVCDGLSADEARADLLQTLPIADRDLGPVSGFFGRSTVIDCNAVIGPRLQKTEVYNDHWRRNRAERQLLALTGSPTAPLGFLCLCRRTSDRPFSEVELRLFDDIRRHIEGAFGALSEARRGWLGRDAVLHALQVGLPQPCGLLDHLGRPIWVNASAQKQFGLRATITADGQLVPARRPELAVWSTAVERVAADGDGLEPRQVGNVTVRRIDRSDALPVFLVTGGSPPAGAGTLSSREREVAELLSRGYSVLNVAVQLGLAEGTVRSHVKSAYRKLGVGSRVELARVLWAT